jgi:hypothetical protein
MIKLIDLLKEDSPFVPRGSKEERKKEYIQITQNKIQQYIKDGMKGDLDLSESLITSLPDELTKVGGDLDLYKASITSLPDNLTEIEGNLDLIHTPITSLPSNLTVGGALNLEYTLITSLPDNLSVGRSLYLSKNKITSLPNNLRVGGNLYLLTTPLSKKYSKDEIKAMVPNVKGYIHM